MKFRQVLCRWLFTGVLAFLGSNAAQATITIEDWTPIFKGVEHAVGRKAPGDGDSLHQVVHVLRIDMTDPDIRIMTTPRITNYVATVREVGAQTVSGFLEEQKLQAAINANFYSPAEVGVVGSPLRVVGALVSGGVVVSSQESQNDSAAVVIDSLNHISFIYTNWPPTNTAKIWNMVSGRYPLVIQGVSVADNSRSPIGGLQPRTAIGASEDRKYMFWMTIDGRQGPYSDGAEDEDTADWLLRFGASDGVNMDGGGSTTMAIEGCLGKAEELNIPSYVAENNRERLIGGHIGLFAKPLPSPIQNVTKTLGRSTAILQWTTELPSTGIVDFGATTDYGRSTVLDSRLSTHHLATLTGLSGGTTFYRITSSVLGENSSYAGCFEITNGLLTDVRLLFNFDQVWKYETNNLDGIPWTTVGYSDAKWLGSGPGLLYVESNPAVGPKGTALPTLSDGSVSVTTYFRTHFNFPSSTLPLSMTFSNFIDDGAVFYLNGQEIQNVRMPSDTASIQYDTLAIAYNSNANCSGDAQMNCPVVFTVPGDSLTSLVKGDNVFAVEVHNYSYGSPDMVFGSTVYYTPPTGTISQPPSIEIDLQSSQTVNLGDPVTLTIGASGSDLRYEWFLNGKSLGAGSSPEWRISSMTLADAGEYRVVVSNNLGTLNSRAVQLTVNAPPSLTIKPVGTGLQILWTGAGFTLQQRDSLSEGAWVAVPGPVTNSPYVLPGSGTTRFFRLAQ